MNLRGLFNPGAKTQSPSCREKIGIDRGTVITPYPFTEKRTNVDCKGWVSRSMFG